MEIEHPRFAIDHAERAEVVTIVGLQRHSGVEAHLRGIKHQWVGVETLIVKSVGHLHQLLLGDGVSAEGHGARCFLHLKPVARQKPLPLLIHQRHQCNRHAQHLRGQINDAIEVRIRGSIQHGKAPQSPKPLLFVGGNRIVGEGRHGFRASRMGSIQSSGHCRLISRRMVLALMEGDQTDRAIAQLNAELITGLEL